MDRILSPRYTFKSLGGSCECDLTWKKNLYLSNQVKMRTFWIRVGPNPMTTDFIKRGHLETKIGNTQGRRPYADKSQKLE